MSQWWAVPMLVSGGLVAAGSPPTPAAAEVVRARWLGGHLVRTAVALACFVLVVVATVA